MYFKNNMIDSSHKLIQQLKTLCFLGKLDYSQNSIFVDD